jgi:hypothetical protein
MVLDIQKHTTWRMTHTTAQLSSKQKLCRTTIHNTLNKITFSVIVLAAVAAFVVVTLLHQ